VIACFYDDDGHFSILSPVYKIARPFSRKRRGPAAEALKSQDVLEATEKEERGARRASQGKPRLKRPTRRSPSIASTYETRMIHPRVTPDLDRWHQPRQKRLRRRRDRFGSSFTMRRHCDSARPRRDSLEEARALLESKYPQKQIPSNSTATATSGPEKAAVIYDSWGFGGRPTPENAYNRS